MNNLLVEKVSLKQNNLLKFETAHVWTVWIAQGGNFLKLVGDFSFYLYPSGRWGWLTDLEKKSKRGQHAVWIIPPGEVSLWSNRLAESFIKSRCVGLRTAEERTSPPWKSYHKTNMAWQWAIPFFCPAPLHDVAFILFSSLSVKEA